MPELMPKSLDAKCDDAKAALEGCLSVSSFVAPLRANHAFNGIVFDIRNRGSVPVRVSGFWVSGCLGRVRIYGTKRYGESSQGLHTSAESWVELVNGVFPKSWTVPIAMVCRSDWDMLLEPGEQRGIYIHSASRATWGQRSTGGIRYHSVWSATEVAGRGEHLEILPGKGHTSPVPFDSSYHAAFRSQRSFAGRISYVVALPAWQPHRNIHLQWPPQFRHGVLSLLLAHRRLGRIAPRKLGKLPKEVLWSIIEFLSHDSFGESNLRAAALSLAAQVLHSARRAALPLRDFYGYMQDDWRSSQRTTPRRDGQAG